MNLFNKFLHNKKIPTILIIDDDIRGAESFSDLLELHGYKTEIAKDGTEGLKKIEKSNPDLVLLDVILPGTKGFDVLSQIKSNPKTMKIPVIMLTGMSGMDDVEKCSKGGAVGYVIKPYNIERILKKIESVLNQQPNSAIISSPPETPTQ